MVGAAIIQIRDREFRPDHLKVSRAWSLGVQVLARRRQPRRRASPSLPGHWRGRRQHGPEGGDAEVGRALGGGAALSAIAAPRACIGVVERFVRLLPEGGIFLVGIVIVVPRRIRVG